jgi:membrane associated rhomboid family serine protease
MIPLKDNVRARSFPFVTAVLIGLNVLVFILELRLPEEDRAQLIWQLGVVPDRLLATSQPGEWLTLVTSQFLHGGWLHLAGNMLALYIFGDNVEDRLGHGRFLAFVLVCRVAGGLLHIWADPSSPIPAVGASGAIAGVLAAYVALFPTARVVTLILVFILPWFIEIPAVVWIGGWIAIQLLNGLLSISSAVEALGGVAYWAHLGGFLAGLILVWPLRRAAPRFHADQYWPW